MLTLAPLDHQHIDPAAALFAAEYTLLRTRAPELPARFLDPAAAAGLLAGMAGRGIAALDDDPQGRGRLLGYIVWWQSTNFRRTGRRGAYVPEWGHATLPEARVDIYRALYRAASAEWAAAGNQVHAISLLANDDVAREAWFWNGFGMLVVDAARPCLPLAAPLGRRPLAIATDLTIRRATADDAPALAALDAEHVAHYAAPPIFMAPAAADTPDDLRAYLAGPRNTIWLALAGDEPVGFMRFRGSDFDAVAVLESDAAAFCDGLYLRPAHRGQGAARAMLVAALDHYAALGLSALYTNFESFNPEAAAFWTRYFRPVCYSLMRVPEAA